MRLLSSYLPREVHVQASYSLSVTDLELADEAMRHHCTALSCCCSRQTNSKWRPKWHSYSHALLQQCFYKACFNLISTKNHMKAFKITVRIRGKTPVPLKRNRKYKVGISLEHMGINLVNFKRKWKLLECFSDSEIYFILTSTA